jgi:hypothetical protein
VLASSPFGDVRRWSSASTGACRSPSVDPERGTPAANTRFEAIASSPTSGASHVGLAENPGSSITYEPHERSNGRRESVLPHCSAARGLVSEHPNADSRARSQRDFVEPFYGVKALCFSGL